MKDFLIYTGYAYLAIGFLVMIGYSTYYSCKYKTLRPIPFYVCFTHILLLIKALWLLAWATTIIAYAFISLCITIDTMTSKAVDAIGDLDDPRDLTR